MNVLVIDVGGSHIKILATGQTEARRMDSGPSITPSEMVEGVKAMAEGWSYDAVAIGYPGVVKNNRPVREPYNLGKGWVDFDFAGAFGRPIKIINDAAMQALGDFKNEKLLFLGLGTGLGTAMVLEGGTVLAMELAHLPYKDSTFEDHVGEQALEHHGKKEWRKRVADVVERLVAALDPDDVVIGGGNVKHLDGLPPGCRAGENSNAFIGGFRLWEGAAK
ncbi:ROK family protein [Variovorax ureilyticus]|uniref:ROK family protein n=1 Tax=Variovorax ureilyticus TaxID=1836198 RepID=A0ABU8VPN2_9BURK